MAVLLRKGISDRLLICKSLYPRNIWQQCPEANGTKKVFCKQPEINWKKSYKQERQISVLFHYQKRYKLGYILANQFHTSSRNNIHPLIWLVVKPLAKIGSIITGRSLRKWWQKLPEGERAGHKEKLHTHRGKILAAFGLLLSAGVVNYVTHLQETPITKRRRYIAFTPEQFSKISAYEYDVQMETAKDKIIETSHPYYQRVLRVTQRIVNANQDLDFMTKQNWTVIVIKSPEQNAFVLPTGHIFVHSGMLDLAQNDDQLAVVLGHEMAHALLTHGAEQVSVAQLVDWLVILVMAAIWFFMPTDGVALVTQWFNNKVVQLLLHLPYSRKLENEADEVGLHLMAKACYDVRESSNFWNVMELITDKSTQDGELAVEFPEWLSTHPSNDTRVDTLNQLIPKAIETRGVYKCPQLGVKDPREYIEFLRHFVEEKTEQGKQVEIIVKPVDEQQKKALDFIKPFLGTKTSKKSDEKEIVVRTN